MPDTSVRQMADPHLHAIRMVARNLKSKDRMQGSQIETARFNLFRALEQENYDEAMAWLNSLDAGLGCLEADKHPAAPQIAKARKSLREILEEETEEAP